MLLPITEKIEGIVGPMKPFIDFMMTPISGMEFTLAVGIENTPLGLINASLKLYGKPEIPVAFFKAAQFVCDLPGMVRGWANSGEILIGDLTGFGTGKVKGTQSTLALPADLAAKFRDIASQSAGGSSDSSRSGFKMIEYLKDINNWKAILTGGDATLFSYAVSYTHLTLPTILRV